MKKLLSFIFVILAVVLSACNPPENMPAWYSKDVYGEYNIEDYKMYTINEIPFTDESLTNKQIIMNLESVGAFSNPETNLVYYIATIPFDAFSSVHIKFYTNIYSWEDVPTENIKIQGIVFSIDINEVFSNIEVIISPAIVLNQ